MTQEEFECSGMSDLDDHLQRMASTGSVGNVHEWGDFIAFVRRTEARVEQQAA